MGFQDCKETFNHYCLCVVNLPQTSHLLEKLVACALNNLFDMQNVLTTVINDDDDDTSSPKSSNSSNIGARANGTFYVRSGNLNSKLTIVCIHGIGSFHKCFDGIAEHLTRISSVDRTHSSVDHHNTPTASIEDQSQSEQVNSLSRYNVLQYDLIGRGDSAYHKSGRFGAEEHLEQLLQLLDHLHVDLPVHVVAHSMGGALATLFASQHPNRVRSLTLLAPAGLMDGTVLALGRACTCLHGVLRRSFDDRAQQERAWRADFYHKEDCAEGAFGSRLEAMVAQMHGMYDTHPHTAFEALWQCVLQFPLYGLQRQARAVAQHEGLPVRIVWGDRDAAVPMRPSLQRWTRILNAPSARCRLECEVVPHGGHSFFLEYPEETGRGIADFLRRVDDIYDVEDVAVETSINTVPIS